MTVCMALPLRTWRQRPLWNEHCHRHRGDARAGVCLSHCPAPSVIKRGRLLPPP